MREKQRAYAGEHGCADCTDLPRRYPMFTRHSTTTTDASRLQYPTTATTTMERGRLGRWCSHFPACRYVFVGSAWPGLTSPLQVSGLGAFTTARRRRRRQTQRRRPRNAAGPNNATRTRTTSSPAAANWLERSDGDDDGRRVNAGCGPMARPFR